MYVRSADCNYARGIRPSLMLLHSLTTDHRSWWCIMRASAAAAVALLGIFTCPAAAQTAVSLCCCVGFLFAADSNGQTNRVDPDDAFRSIDDRTSHFVANHFQRTCIHNLLCFVFHTCPIDSCIDPTTLYVVCCTDFLMCRYRRWWAR